MPEFSTTWQIVWVDPRSTCSHCGSEYCEDQRVAALPSTADDAGVPAFSTDDAVAVADWLNARLVVPQLAADALDAVSPG